MSEELKSAVEQMVYEYKLDNPDATEEQIGEYLLEEVIDIVAISVASHFECEDAY